MIEWGPLIKHDGAEPVWEKTATRIERWIDLKPGLIGPSPDGMIDAAWPGFYWRWKVVKTGWFRSERVRVCDDPAYAPIIAYRFGWDRNAAVEMLREIAANPPPLPADDADAGKPERVPG